MGYYLHLLIRSRLSAAVTLDLEKEGTLADEQRALLASRWLDVLIPSLPVERLGSHDELKPIYASYLFIL